MDEQHSNLSQAIYFANLTARYSISINGVALSVSLVGLTQLDPGSTIWVPHALPFWFYVGGVFLGGLYMCIQTLYSIMSHIAPVLEQINFYKGELVSISSGIKNAEATFSDEEKEETKRAFDSASEIIKTLEASMAQSVRDIGPLFKIAPFLKFLTRYLPVLSLVFFLLGTIGIIRSLNIPL